MQTPGSVAQPQTPMIPMERRMDAAYERLLQRAEEENQGISRPEIRSLGRIILQMERLNNNMTAMQRDIQRDIRERRKFFIAEQKLLKKDSENLQGFRAAALFGSRQNLAALSGAYAALEFGRGDIAGGLQATGLSALLLSPEIIDGIIGALAIRGVLPRGSTAMRGGAVAGMSRQGGLLRNIGGKGGLLAIASLVALLLLGNQGAANAGDQRRSQFVATGQQVINEPDVLRFSSQLTRFENILDSMGGGLDTKKGGKGIASDELGSEIEKKPGLPWKPFGGFFDKKEEDTPVVEEQPVETSQVPEEKSSDIASRTIQVPVERDNAIDGALDLDGITASLKGPPRSTVLSSARANMVSDLPEIFATAPNVVDTSSFDNMQPSINIGDINLDDEGDGPLDWLAMLLPTSNGGSGGRNNVIVSDNGGKTTELPVPREGIAPASALVHTKFLSSGGIYDKFDSASSLRTYAAFS